MILSVQDRVYTYDAEALAVLRKNYKFFRDLEETEGIFAARNSISTRHVEAPFALQLPSALPHDLLDWLFAPSQFAEHAVNKLSCPIEFTDAFDAAIDWLRVGKKARRAIDEKLCEQVKQLRIRDMKEIAELFVRSLCLQRIAKYWLPSVLVFNAPAMSAPTPQLWREAWQQRALEFADAALEHENCSRLYLEDALAATSAALVEHLPMPLEYALAWTFDRCWLPPPSADYVVAGGAVLNALLSLDCPNSDIDIFVLRGDWSAVARLLQHYASFKRQTAIARQGTALTLAIEGAPLIQIVVTQHLCAFELITAFDIDAVRCYYDPLFERAISTIDCAKAVRSRAIVSAFTHLRKCRIAKLRQKGFRFTKEVWTRRVEDYLSATLALDWSCEASLLQTLEDRLGECDSISLLCDFELPAENQLTQDRATLYLHDTTAIQARAHALPDDWLARLISLDRRVNRDHTAELEPIRFENGLPIGFETPALMCVAESAHLRHMPVLLAQIVGSDPQSPRHVDATRLIALLQYCRVQRGVPHTQIRLDIDFSRPENRYLDYSKEFARIDPHSASDRESLSFRIKIRPTTEIVDWNGVPCAEPRYGDVFTAQLSFGGIWYHTEQGVWTPYSVALDCAIIRVLSRV